MVISSFFPRDQSDTLRVTKKRKRKGEPILSGSEPAAMGSTTNPAVPAPPMEVTPNPTEPGEPPSKKPKPGEPEVPAPNPTPGEDPPVKVPEGTKDAGTALPLLIYEAQEMYELKYLPPPPNRPPEPPVVIKLGYAITDTVLPINFDLCSNVTKWEYLGKFNSPTNPIPDPNPQTPGHFRFKVYVTNWNKYKDLHGVRLGVLEYYNVEMLVPGRFYVDSPLTVQQGLPAFNWPYTELMRMTRLEPVPNTKTFWWTSAFVSGAPGPDGNLREYMKQVEALIARHNEEIHSTDWLKEIGKNFTAFANNMAKLGLPGAEGLVTDQIALFVITQIGHQKQLNPDAYLTKPLWAVQSPQYVSQDRDAMEQWKEWSRAEVIYLSAKIVEALMININGSTYFKQVRDFVEKSPAIKRIERLVNYAGTEDQKKAFMQFKTNVIQIFNLNYKGYIDELLKKIFPDDAYY